MQARTRVRGAAAAALVVATALTACGGGDDDSGPAPTKWSADDATNTSDKAGEKVDDDEYKVVAGGAWNDLKLPDGGTSAMVDPQTWPDVQKLLTSDQLKGILPAQNLDNPKYCAFLRYNVSGGGQTPKNAQCSWDLGDGNRLRLDLRGIGADSEVVDSWDGVRSTYRESKNKEDSFYKDGTYGARRALLLRRGLGSFVISNGEIAAWFDVQYPDDDFIVDDSAPATFKEIRTKSFPTMVETFVHFLPREH